MAPKIVEVRTAITPATFARMGQVRILLAFAQRVDVNGVVKRIKDQMTKLWKFDSSRVF